MKCGVGVGSSIYNDQATLIANMSGLHLQVASVIVSDL